jgi:hypothetical protein
VHKVHLVSSVYQAYHPIFDRNLFFRLSRIAAVVFFFDPHLQPKPFELIFASRGILGKLDVLLTKYFEIFKILYKTED